MKRIFTILATTFLALGSFAQTGTPTRPAGQKEAPKVEAAAPSSKTPVPTGKYVTGGVIASVIGLGIGHGIQGRYAEKGWIFTATEAAGIAMVMAGCNDRKDRDGDGDKECNNAGLAGAGALIAIGFHIWEVVDVWTTATPVDDTQPVAFLLPNPEAPGIGVAWRF